MIIRKSMLLGATFIFVMMAGQTSSAQGGRWVYLGEANVDGNNDHDRISVGGGKGTFRALQIQVERAAIDFQYILVHFENGGNDRLELRGKVPAGGRSRVIDLKGNNRAIDSVEIWYAKGELGQLSKAEDAPIRTPLKGPTDRAPSSIKKKALNALWRDEGPWSNAAGSET